MFSRPQTKAARDNQSNRAYTDDNTKYLKSILNILETKKAEDEIAVEWQELAKLLDRLFLVIYLTASILLFLYFFIKTVT